VRNVGFFLVDDLLFDRARRAVIGGNGSRRLGRGRSSGKRFRLGRRFTVSAGHFFDDFVMFDHRLAGESRSQVHTILQCVLALPLLVNGFIAMLVRVLFVQWLGETGGKQRLIVRKARGTPELPGEAAIVSFTGLAATGWLARPRYFEIDSPGRMIG